MERRILQAEGSFYMPMKDEETKEQAMERFDNILCVDDIEFASYKIKVVNDEGDEVNDKE